MRRLLALAAVLVVCPTLLGADGDTPAAARTRKLLKEKVTVEFKDTRLEDAIDELKDQVKGLKVLLDAKGGVSRNQAINYTGKDVTVEEALDGMFKKSDLGYIVISNRANAYDGAVQIRKGRERGTPNRKD